MCSIFEYPTQFHRIIYKRKRMISKAAMLNIYRRSFRITFDLQKNMYVQKKRQSEGTSTIDYSSTSNRKYFASEDGPFPLLSSICHILPIKEKEPKSVTEKFPLFRILLLRYYNPILSNFVDLRNGEQCANNNKVMTFKLKNEFIISYEFGVLFLVYILQNTVSKL